MIAGRTRGRPLVALVVVLCSWVGARAMTWDDVATGARFSPVLSGSRLIATAGGDPFARAEAGAHAAATDREPERSGFGTSAAVAAIGSSLRPPVGLAASQPRQFARTAGPAVTGADVRAPAAGGWFTYQLPQLPALGGPGMPRAFVAADASQRSTLASAVAPAPRVVAPGGNEAPLVPVTRPTTGSARRWSGDAWLLARRGGGSLPASGGPAPATYGASQAGAVLRYALARDSANRPAAHLRATAALEGSEELEAAAGLSARPLARVPVIAAAELRATRVPGRTRLRPAAMAITQLPPATLAYGTRAEAYLQGGYVGGAGATGFIDGQLRIDRRLARVGGSELRVGAGGWGGAQKGASRLDVGPAATLGIALGPAVSARLALDWRLRIAGDAEPDSGPALTLSAGF